jgi:hypothetical protein
MRAWLKAGLRKYVLACLGGGMGVEWSGNNLWQKVRKNNDHMAKGQGLSYDST